jgi:hypothetical protein
MTDFAAWGIGGAFLGCMVCGLCMACYFPSYRWAKTADLPFGISDWYWDILSRSPEPDPFPWLLIASVLGFASGLFIGPRFGRPKPPPA